MVETNKPQSLDQGSVDQYYATQILEKSQQGHEIRIVWKYKPTEFSYLRESICLRYWWLRSYDHDICPRGVYATRAPNEAVVPGSIEVNSQSCHFYWKGGRA